MYTSLTVHDLFNNRYWFQNAHILSKNERKFGNFWHPLHPLSHFSVLQYCNLKILDTPTFAHLLYLLPQIQWGVTDIPKNCTHTKGHDVIYGWPITCSFRLCPLPLFFSPSFATPFVWASMMRRLAWIFSRMKSFPSEKKTFQ